MQIPIEIRRKWKKLKSHGDHGKIKTLFETQNETTIHVDTIRRAMRSGKATDLVFHAIADYYEAKFAKFKELI